MSTTADFRSTLLSWASCCTSKPAFAPTAADLLEKKDDLSAVTAAHFADSIAVKGDPLAHVNVTINK